MNTDATGVTNLLKGRKWNEDLAGVISAWRDPADGQAYVVNGHHRYQLASENARPDVTVRMIDAPTAAAARAIGALQNIALWKRQKESACGANYLQSPRKI